MNSSGTLFYINHDGVHTDISHLPPRTYLFLDSNVCIKIWQRNRDQDVDDLIHFLRNSNQRHSFSKNGGYPVDLALASAENSKQDIKPKYIKFAREFEKTFKIIFPGSEYQSEWLQKKHWNTLKIIRSCKDSTEKTISKIYELVEEKTPKSNQILENCDELISWLWRNKENLSHITGHLIYLGVYAIAGSPEAKMILKSSSKSAHGSARNVAWDFMYWICMEIDYLFDDMESIAICTYDKGLCTLLGQRRNLGPRYIPSEFGQFEYLLSHGELNGFQLARLEDTKLAGQIRDKLAFFWKSLDAFSTDTLKVGFPIPPSKKYR